jgi:hypothetical protein
MSKTHKTRKLVLNVSLPLSPSLSLSLPLSPSLSLPLALSPSPPPLSQPSFSLSHSLTLAVSLSISLSRVSHSLACALAHSLARSLALAALQDDSAGGASTGPLTGGGDASAKRGRKIDDPDTSSIYTESQA